MNRAPSRLASAFSLVELLVVLSIITIAMAMIMSAPANTDRAAQTRAAADQLAATLRALRARSIDEKAMYGVAFNIQNAPGTSGKVLNNWSGGHWWRVIGPRMNPLHNNEVSRAAFGEGMIPSANRKSNMLANAPWNEHLDNPFQYWVDEVQASWAGDPVVLPPRKVRFLALGDQDNGNVRHLSRRADTCQAYRNFYPRPWFGLYDATTNKLRPWGGYDPAVKDFVQPVPENSQDWGRWQGPFVSGITNEVVSYSGFYYEGDDGAISDSRHPRDRLIAADHDGDGAYRPSSTDAIDGQLFRQGEPRPLVNAAWLDAVIYFRPDGTAMYDRWMNARHQWSYMARWPGGSPFTYNLKNLYQLGPADMCNRLEVSTAQSHQLINLSGTAVARLGNLQEEVSHYVDLTGSWSITLGPDATSDSDEFPSAQAAWRSVMPCWRVQVSPSGDVRVVPVRGTQPTRPPPFNTIDGTISGTWYENATNLSTRCANGVPTGPAGERRVPAEDFVTPAMMEERTWWLQ